MVGARNIAPTPVKQHTVGNLETWEPSGEQVAWREYLKKLSGDDFLTLDAIATCESRYQQKWNYLHDTNPDYYTAYGIFQVVRGHEATYGLDRTTPEGNIELAVKLYADKGLAPWKASEMCIQKLTGSSP